MAEQLETSRLDQKTKSRHVLNLHAINATFSVYIAECIWEIERRAIVIFRSCQHDFPRVRQMSVLFLTCLLAACQYKASASFSPALDVYSSYKDKIQGTYLLHVASDQLFGEFRVSGYDCSAHSYSLDLTQAFEGSVVRTIENLIERIDQSEIALDRHALRLQGYRGLIRVIGEDIEVDIKVIPGFWSAEMEAETKLTAAYVVDGLEGRLAGGRVYAEGKERHDAGAACSGGTIAVGKSAERALRRLMQQLGERIANEPRLRHSTE